MGAAYRSPKARELKVIAQMIGAVRALGLETCATLGMLAPEQAQELKQAGLDYYNHNLDTSAEFYGEIISTHAYQDRLDTLSAVRSAGIEGVLRRDRGPGRVRRRPRRTAAHARQSPRASRERADQPAGAGPRHPARRRALPVDPFDFVRTIALARLLMPRAHVRLSAGREAMSDELQALCFLAGANSIFYGEKLLTTGNPDVARDRELFARLGLSAQAAPHSPAAGAAPAPRVSLAHAR